jgi:hypothetical protein
MQPETLQIATNPELTVKPKRPQQRHWEIQDKRRIVEETFVPGASVSVVARRNDVNSNMLFRWRREYRRGEFGPAAPDRATKSASLDFVRVGVIGEDGRLVQNMGDGRQELCSGANEASSPGASRPIGNGSKPSVSPGRIELELPGLARITFDANLDDVSLRRLITLVKELA